MHGSKSMIKMMHDSKHKESPASDNWNGGGPISADGWIEDRTDWGTSQAQSWRRRLLDAWWLPAARGRCGRRRGRWETKTATER